MVPAFQIIIAILLLAALAAWLAQFLRTPQGRQAIVRITSRLRRAAGNPLLTPIAHHDWESEAVFNPAAIELGGRIHLLYRAIGADGISRLGYASSADGLTFDERLPYPVFQVVSPRELERKRLGKKRRYDPVLYPSGGSWGGCEDPRLVSIEEHVYLTFNAFDGWDYIRVASVSLPAAEFARKWWAWSRPLLLSPKGQVHKNWVLFPEKIN
ncbi:MAG TPA: hypothetical protein VFL98_02535, partial [Candidatus Paceibacterota bacterium]|nr:hypothetical protein [Candidatus Paceibacterota bacterium]